MYLIIKGRVILASVSGRSVILYHMTKIKGK